MNNNLNAAMFMQENGMLRHALRVCIDAHETGRFEPAQAAYENAKNLLDDLAATPQALELMRHPHGRPNPQNTADPGEGIDRPSTVKTSDVSTARENDSDLEATKNAAYLMVMRGGHTPIDTAVGSMPNSVPPSTPGDDSANAAEGTQSREAEHALRQAHILICWTWQSHAIRNGVKKRGWWHVKDLNPQVRVMMGSAEQGLYDALMKTPD